MRALIVVGGESVVCLGPGAIRECTNSNFMSPLVYMVGYEVPCSCNTGEVHLAPVAANVMFSGHQVCEVLVVGVRTLSFGKCRKQLAFMP